MRARKLLPLIIIVIILQLALASCAGIGDGALIGDINPSDIDTSKYALVAELRFYDANGTFEVGCDIDNEDANEIRELFLNGEYVEGLDRNSIDMPYFEVFFRRDKHTNLPGGTVYDGEYRIYLDGYVLQETLSGTVQKGHLGGVYEKLTAYLPEFTVPAFTQSDEQLAGFAFNMLIIATEPGKNYAVSDFPEIDCISVKPSM